MDDVYHKVKSLPVGAAQFATTQWSIVVAAGHRSLPDSQQALESLCRSYWYPLYVYVRRRVSDVQLAQDLTQGFFVALLEGDSLRAADRDRGRFRSFLLTSFKNFLANEWGKARAQKRGGGCKTVPLDLDSAEHRYSLEPVDELSPERLYDRQWALALLDEVLNSLRNECITKGKEKLFQTLKPFLTGDSAPGGYKDAARELATSEAAAKVAAHRLRQRYREILRTRIAGTVAEPVDVEDEIRALMATLS
jgi:DNA-directed RNA polymerase specialized sigma24 family protein